MTDGIDVSSFQGLPNWNAVRAAGYGFAYIKATEGVDYVSPTLDGQFHGAVNAGLPVGLYHFGQPGNAPEDDADTFATQVNTYRTHGPGFLPPCLDLEVGTGDLSWWAQRFIARLRAQTGVSKVMVYSGAYFFRDQITETWMDPDIAVWIATYGVTPGGPAYLTPRVAMHQYASDGSVPGIAGNVDLDLALVDMSELTAQPGGIEDMALDTTYTDWDGNQQTVQSWMNHLDQRLAELHSIFLDPGEEPSRIPGDSNRTNLRDMIMDAGAWTNLTLGATARIETALANQSGVDAAKIAADLGPVISAVVGPLVRQAVVEAVGSENTTLADDIIAKIGAKLAGSTTSANSG